ncbi:hypothetical protein IC006_0956 [Sulfuracidifex tepidarius]|uniref:Uncharacterized protein n=1 Tax=Sulfuracidifex tepidarius TaxID=1294262 RepID=A0A510E1S1_9CREN|nr:hypothetical protein IC006_0956 [Sulfuracidifex tepidarius]BBG26417.1 hypothetical protein IC007_0925 [Sulfuracidifex tepidarius]
MYVSPTYSTEFRVSFPHERELRAFDKESRKSFPPTLKVRRPLDEINY